MVTLVKIFASFTLIAFLSVSAFAFEGGNPKKGKYLYKKNCKSCHVSGGEGGELTPLSKTQSQWDRFFDKNQHPGDPEVLKQLSDQEVQDIHQFLFDHAADSDQPETCG